MQKGFVTAGAAAIIALIVIVFGVSAYKVINNSNPVEEPVACTAEAKLCPDGSYVGRVAPDCNFAKCPNLDINDQNEIDIIPDTENDKKDDLDTIACTADAKLCPDGSYVGRVAPDCNFKKCPSTKVDVDPEIPPDLGNCNGPNEDCTCSEGYTKAVQPILSPEPYYYCKINMDWEDFKTCSLETDCNNTSGFYCIGKMQSNDTESYGTDFRCIPTKSYKMGCLCELDGGCMCS